MKKILCIVLIFTLKYVGSSSVLWQLGTPDDSAKEFWDASNAEFRTNPLIFNSPDYSREKRIFTYRLPVNKHITHPHMPGGIGGSGKINNSIVTTQKIEWNEENSGWRLFELRMLPGRNHSAHRAKPNDSMDIDGTDVPCPGLLVSAPGNRKAFLALPYDLEAQISKNGPVTLLLHFPVVKGMNELLLHENSGLSYGRNYFFDYLRLTETKPTPAVPMVEYSPGKGFPYKSIYISAVPAELNVTFFNLEPQTRYEGETEFVDLFDRVVKRERYVIDPDADGMYVRAVDCPQAVNGHFRVRTKLLCGGKAVVMQTDIPKSETRIAAVRMVAPLTDAEVEASCLALSGLPSGDLYRNYPWTPQPEDYRVLRRFLQVRHDRLHWLAWYVVEPEEGKREWEWFDLLIDAEADDGIRLQLNVMGTPDWMLKKHLPELLKENIWKRWMAVPPDIDAFAAFCADTARRYRGKIADLEVWNEVSAYSMFWPGGNVRQYAELLRKVRKAVRDVAPELPISAQTLWARQDVFTNELFNFGVAADVDVHMDHYIDDLRTERNMRVLKEQNLPAKYISNEDRMDRTSNAYGFVDEKSRREAVRNLIRNYLYHYVHGVTRIYNFRLISSSWRTWGMVGPDCTPKYTYSAFKTLNNRLAGSRPAGYRRLNDKMERFDLEYTNPVRVQENGGDYAVVFCNSGLQPVRIFLPASGSNVTMVDVMDNQREIPVKDGQVTIEVGEFPVFLYGLNRDLIKLADSLTLEPKSLTVSPGGNCVFSATLPEGKAKLEAMTSFGEKQAWEITKDSGNTFSLPIPKNLPNGIYYLNFTGALLVDGHQLPFQREFRVFVEDRMPGEQLMPRLNNAHWVFWGKGTPSFEHGKINITVPAGEVGAVRTIAPINLIPGEDYHLSFVASGKGTLRVQAHYLDAKGETVNKVPNLIMEKLTPEDVAFQTRFAAPEGCSRMILHFYFFKEKTDSWFIVDACKMIRLEKEKPLPRQLMKKQATYVKNIKVDGILDEWTGVAFTPITETIFKDIPIKAEFAAQWNSENLFLAIRVKDRVHFNPYRGADVWQGDSVQFALEPSMENGNVPAIRMAFALTDKGLYGYCHETIPVPEIIPSYTRGPLPENVEFSVARHGEESFYEIKIPVERLKPSLQFKPGMKVAFSILVNNNDSNERTWLQWSSGIAQSMNSTLFGSLEFCPQQP